MGCNLKSQPSLSQPPTGGHARENSWNKCSVVRRIGSLVRKCLETVVGLEILDRLSTGLQRSLERPLSRRLVSQTV